jgi:hypothetical protein
MTPRFKAFLLAGVAAALAMAALLMLRQLWPSPVEPDAEVQRQWAADGRGVET